ncbi:MAG: serine/threonine protein kinase, partial [Planctomycetes bacterium]|nr:serine/threonine protein kinase [Planctomycetota bacterium]
MIPGYKLQGEIARGGMGVVFRGLDARGQVVAIKVAKKTGAADLARFEREAEVLADLSHPGIVSIHATGVVNGCPYLVMDLVEGPSLEQIVRQGGPLSERRAVEICLALAKALEEVHRQEILHRDVKPDNVLMRGEQPVLVDFGIAKDTQATGQELTRTGAFLGTPGYAPLEQALGRKNALGPHTDVYGLGATLYFLATGRAPFEASELRELLARMNVGADAPSSLRAKLSAEFDAVCLMCLAPAPADRYPTAAALAEDLELLLAGGRPSASKAGGLGLAPRRPRWALPAGGSILLFGLLSAVVALNRPPPASPSPGAAEAPTSSPEATPDFGEIERLLGRGRHLEALDRLDRLPEPPTKLVWSALLPALQPLARHGTTNGLKAGLLLLERPAGGGRERR